MKYGGTRESRKVLTYISNFSISGHALRMETTQESFSLSSIVNPITNCKHLRWNNLPGLFNSDSFCKTKEQM
jgi:hypothetical protein